MLFLPSRLNLCYSLPHCHELNISKCIITSFYNLISIPFFKCFKNVLQMFPKKCLRKCFKNATFVNTFFSVSETHWKHIVDAKPKPFHEDPNWAYQMDLHNFVEGSHQRTKVCDVYPPVVRGFNFLKTPDFQSESDQNTKMHFNTLWNVLLMTGQFLSQSGPCVFLLRDRTWLS